MAKKCLNTSYELLRSNWKQLNLTVRSQAYSLDAHLMMIAATSSLVLQLRTTFPDTNSPWLNICGLSVSKSSSIERDMIRYTFESILDFYFAFSRLSSNLPIISFLMYVQRERTAHSTTATEQIFASLYRTVPYIASNTIFLAYRYPLLLDGKVER